MNIEQAWILSFQHNWLLLIGIIQAPVMWDRSARQGLARQGLARQGFIQNLTQSVLWSKHHPDDLSSMKSRQFVFFLLKECFTNGAYSVVNDAMTMLDYLVSALNNLRVITLFKIKYSINSSIAVCPFEMKLSSFDKIISSSM